MYTELEVEREVDRLKVLKGKLLLIRNLLAQFGFSIEKSNKIKQKKLRLKCVLFSLID